MAGITPAVVRAKPSADPQANERAPRTERTKAPASAESIFSASNQGSVRFLSAGGRPAGLNVAPAFGNRRTQAVLAARQLSSFRVSEPGDAGERAAERLGEETLRMPEGRIDAPVRAWDGHRDWPNKFGAGSPLETSSRRFFEARLGPDINRVRIHTDPHAGWLALSLNAAAFALGRDVAFAPGLYQPSTGAGRSLLAHELAHAVRPEPHVIQRRVLVDATQAAITPDDVAAMSTDELQQQTIVVERYLGGVKAESVRTHLAAQNLTALENAARQRFNAQAGGAVQFGGDADPVEPSATGEGSLACTATPVIQYTPAPSSTSTQQCVQEPLRPDQPGAIVRSGLGEKELLDSYKGNARTLLNFHIDAMREWLLRVVKKEITTPTGRGSEKVAQDLQAAARVANQLGREVHDAKDLVKAYDDLIENRVPREGHPVPEISWQTTIGSEKYIREHFTRAALTAGGYPAEIPDITTLLDHLGFKPSITKDDVTNFLVEHATESQLHDPDYLKDDVQRGMAQQLLELDPDRAADPAEVAVLDTQSTAPAYNFNALRFVTNRLRAAAATKLALAQQKLEEHLSAYPLLRTYIRDWSLLRPDLLPGLGYRDLIDPVEITAQSLTVKFDQLVSELEKLKKNVLTDDDFLFDSAIQGTLAPLIDLYGEASSQYARWIHAKFVSNQKWRDAVSTLLTVLAITGLMLAEALSAGLATGFALAGAAAGIAAAYRSEKRASLLQQAAHAGIGDRDAAAAADFQAWLDTAMAALGVLQAVARPAVSALRAAIAAIRTGRAATVNVRLLVLYLGRLTAAEAAQLSRVAQELEKVLADAVRIVDSGQGTTRWARILTGGGPLSGTALARGNAIHFEAYALIAQNPYLRSLNVLTNAGRAVPQVGLINGFGRLRPDVRLPLLSGVPGREALCDFTTVGQAGHAAHYIGAHGGVEAVFEVLY
jgi:hypothetical protein